ncbi:uncharacterized protein LOC135687775 [Rhopilema esculentum]|uniref:uncharacterized protein LOC135687775 n=1 Tax=Rhopilema esculentum TaxID=499914 RepID=UPI0031D68A78
MPVMPTYVEVFKTRMPRVALSLIQEKTGKIYVKYSGPPEFREFGHDPGIIKEFFEVALKGLQGGVGPGNLDGKTQQDEDLDQNLVNEFLQLDLLSFDTVHKRKMITAAVCGTGKCILFIFYITTSIEFFKLEKATVKIFYLLNL